MFRLGDRKVSEGWDDLLLSLSPNLRYSFRGIQLARERNLVYATTLFEASVHILRESRPVSVN